MYLIPYYFRYSSTNEFPDGRAFIFQPRKLVLMFELWTMMSHKIAKKQEDKQIENNEL